MTYEQRNKKVTHIFGLGFLLFFLGRGRFRCRLFHLLRFSRRFRVGVSERNKRREERRSHCRETEWARIQTSVYINDGRHLPIKYPPNSG